MAQPWPDYPEVFLRGLEQTVEGCEWLLRKWKEMDDLCRSDCPWTHTDRWKFIRLQGLQPCEAVNNAFINRQFLAFDVVDPGRGLDFWRVVELVTPQLEPAFNWCAKWRELVPRPADWERGVCNLARHRRRPDCKAARTDRRAQGDRRRRGDGTAGPGGVRGQPGNGAVPADPKRPRPGAAQDARADHEDAKGGTGDHRGSGTGGRCIETEEDLEAETVTMAAEPVASQAEEPVPASEPPRPKPGKADPVALEISKNAQNEAKSDCSQSPVAKKVKATLPESEYAKQTQFIDQVTSWLIARQREASERPQPESGG